MCVCVHEVACKRCVCVCACVYASDGPLAVHEVQ